MRAYNYEKGKVLGSLIREKRQVLNLTQQEFAALVAKDKQRAKISAIENGEFKDIGPDTMQAVLHGLNIEDLTLIHEVFGSQIVSEWSDSVEEAFHSDPRQMVDAAAIVINCPWQYMPTTTATKGKGEGQ